MRTHDGQMRTMSLLGGSTFVFAEVDEGAEGQKKV